MVYICLECGSAEGFIGYQLVTDYGNEIIFVDCRGDTIDYGDIEYTDREVDDRDITECENCGSENIEWVDNIAQIKDITEGWGREKLIRLLDFLRDSAFLDKQEYDELMPEKKYLREVVKEWQ